MTTLTRAQVREIDRRADEEYGVPGIVLMENAGRGAAEVLMRLNPEREPVLVLWGAGNNGGDGAVLARHLDNAGWPVRLWRGDPGARTTRDAAFNADIVRNGGLRIDTTPPASFAGVWVVDALFGTGLSRPVGPPHDGVIAEVNASGAPVLALDLPSGLDCDTGEPLGVCVRATHTVTFVAPKAGFANPAAARWLGTVHVAGIGAPRKLLAEYGV